MPFAFLAFIAPLVLCAVLATLSSRARTMAPFPNITHTFSIDATCFPFEDPDCCVDMPVCQCANGTFYSTNPQYANGTSSLCGPPGNVTLGGDTSSIPGFCC
ncbi:hypothetical protein GGR52DRAFT_570138 [Hypoxylon sp. FL1284]|nr:hypothetical protein GGR52DRAFT_570138 [Hypoxylon sp. FL1284]